MSQPQFRLAGTTFSSASVGLAVFDAGGRYLSVNTELAYINGLPAEDHPGRHLEEVVPALAPALLPIMERVHRSGEAEHGIELTGETRRRPGTHCHWLCGFYPYRDPVGEVHGVGCWVVELPERRRPAELQHAQQREAQAALEASRLRLQMGIQAAGLVLAEIDYRANMNHIAVELARLLELGEFPMTVPRQAIFDRIHPDDRQRYLAAIRAALDPAGSGHLAIDVRALLPGGALRWLHIRLQVTFACIDGQLRPDRGICAARDVTAETLADRKLRAAQRFAESVIEGSGALVYAKDLEGRYILSNQAWRTQHGLTPEQALGATDEQLFGPGLAAVLRANDARVVASSEAVTVQEPITLHGQQIVYRSNKFPLYDETGRVHAVCGVSTDITDVVTADRRKDEFIATLAHELRNPLAPLRTGLEILKRAGELPPQAARVRAMMERQLDHMVRLVDDLLDVSRISRDKLELRLAPLTLAQVVELALEAAQPAVQAAGHALTLELAPQPIPLHGDLTRLAQVVGNLVSNAAKYTPRGGRIRVAGRREGEWAVLEVQDDGVGIEPAMLAHVFDLFVQGAQARSGPQTGLGIGLWLVRKLVELHHGTIGAASAGPGQGSTFTLRLPVATAGT